MPTVTWRENRMYLVSDEILDEIEAVLHKLFAGEGPDAFTDVLNLAKAGSYNSGVISHALAMMMDLEGPRSMGANLSSDEWREMMDNFSEAWESYYDLQEVFVKWFHRLEQKLGAF